MAMKNVKPLVCLYVSLLLHPLASGQSLEPGQIVDKYVLAHQTLNFSEVAPYVHSHTLAAYRQITTSVINRAIRSDGSKAIMTFFQGTPVEELGSLSDQEYWAFLMASSLQFNLQRPEPARRPLAQFWENPFRLSLVYRGSGIILGAPEFGRIPGDMVFTFEQENGGWKMVTFTPNVFETTLHWYLEQRCRTKVAGSR